MSLYAGHLACAVYDVTDSEYDIDTIADNLVLREKKGMTNPEECLNDWLGFRESTHKDYYNQNVPELSPEYGDYRTFTEHAVRIINACRDFYANEGLDICTKRMMSFLQWAKFTLYCANGDAQKILEAETLYAHMKEACVMLTPYGTHI